MTDANNQEKTKSNIDVRLSKWIVFGAFVIVFSSFFLKFHDHISDDNGVWGAFGDYIGGLLNPIIAGFAFYLIAETYKLQKYELEETRKLLKASTDAQKHQIDLAALTALLNSNLTRINLIRIEHAELWNEMPEKLKELIGSELSKNITRDEVLKKIQDGDYIGLVYNGSNHIIKRIVEIEDEVKLLTDKIIDLEKNIENFCNK